MHSYVPKTKRRGVTSGVRATNRELSLVLAAETRFVKLDRDALAGAVASATVKSLDIRTGYFTVKYNLSPAFFWISSGS